MEGLRPKEAGTSSCCFALARRRRGCLGDLPPSSTVKSGKLAGKQRIGSCRRTRHSINRPSREDQNGRKLSIDMLHTLLVSSELTADFQALRLIQNTRNRSRLLVGLTPWPKLALRRDQQQVRRPPQEALT